MMSFRTRKLILAEALVAAYLLMRAITWYHGFLEHCLTFGYTEEAALGSALSGGYFGGEELGLMMPLVVMLLTDYIMDKEETPFLIRYPAREQYLRHRFLQLAAAVFLYNVLYIVVGLGYLALQFSSALMFSEQTLQFAFRQFWILFFYAARTCVLYMLLRDLLNKRFLAMGIVLLLYLTMFYLVMDQWLYPILKKTITMSSFGDITAAGVAYIGAIPASVCQKAAIRQFVMLVIAALVWSLLWKKKDVIRLER